MAKLTISIGNQSNDGTGDSIREAFNKTNQNFSELYNVTGLGQGIKFTQLADTPNTLLNNAILVSSTSTIANTVTQIP